MGWIIEHKYAHPNDISDAWNATSESWEPEDFDTFTDVERETLTLPVDGVWELVSWEAA